MPSSRPSLAFVLPGFDAATARNVVARLHHLIAGASEIERTVEDYGDWQPWQWKFARIVQLRSPLGFASAPTTWIGTRSANASGSWMHADPVHLEMIANGFVLRECGRWRAADLELFQSLAATHCARSDWAWHSAGGSLFLHSTRPIEIETVSPAQAAQSALEQVLPSGRDSGPVRRLMTELQMLMHEKFSGPAFPNAVWLWGHGALKQASKTEYSPRPLLWTDDPFARGVYRLLGADDQCRPLPNSIESVLSASEAHVVVASALSETELDSEWLVPASRALDAGRLDRIELHFDTTSVAARTSLLGRVLARGRRFMQRASVESRP